jgi:hypothetical protein
MAAPAALDNLGTVLNTARARLNDRIDTLAFVTGKILDTGQWFSLQMVNNGWRKLQERLADLGFSFTRTTMVFPAVPAVSVADPGIQVYFNYNGYWNGAAMSGLLALPGTLVAPLELMERPTGAVPLAQFTTMDPITSDLPLVNKQPWNRQWQWIGGQLIMPGATRTTDIWMQFEQFYPDFADLVVGSGYAGTTPWYQLPVPIPRCSDSFADYICREFMIAQKNLAGAEAFQASAEALAVQVLNRDTTKLKEIYKGSEFSKMRDKYTPNSGDTQPVSHP